MATPKSLANLLAAWRKKRTPELADEIDQVSVATTAKEKPLKGKAEWWAAFETKRPEILERLLELAPSGLDRVARIDALCSLPADPRMGTFARKWLEHPPVVAKSRAPFFAAVVRMLEHVRDVRVLPTLRALVADRRDAIRKCGLPNYKLLQAHAEALESQAPRAKTTAPKKKAEGADALFAQVYASPDDDAVRAVLADLLSENGDPRGELITLQLARHGKNQPPSAQEKKLLSTWGRTWLGAIGPCLLKDGVTFTRGFVSHVRYGGGGNDAAPEWSTVEHIDVRHARGDGARLLTSPALKSLRHATGLGEPELQAVMKKWKKVPWATLGLALNAWDNLERVVRENQSAVRGVKKLVTENRDGVWKVNAPVITKLLKLLAALEEAELDLETNFPRLIEENPKVRRLSVRGEGFRPTFDRKSKTLEIVITHGWARPQPVVALVKAIAPSTIVLSTMKKAKLLEDDALQLGPDAFFEFGAIRRAAKKSRIVVATNDA